MAELFAKLSADVDVGGLVVDDTLAGQVRVRTYTPRQRDGLTAGVLYVHSGGFVVGSLDSEHSMAALIASRLGVAVVSVDYRLAPEHPYPAGLEDCHTAAPWLRANAARLGVDAERIGVYGNSAGAGLAASLTLLMRDRRDPPFCFQFLGVAQLDDRLDTPSMLRFVDTPLWSRPKAERSWRHYLGERAGDVPAYAAPARAADLSGLPPAYVSAMEFDLCGTRTSSTRCDCCRRASPWSCTSTRARSTAPR